MLQSSMKQFPFNRTFGWSQLSATLAEAPTNYVLANIILDHLDR